MHTDAAHRFERGVDPQLPRLAVERASALALEILGGRAGPLTDTQLSEHLPTPAAVTLRRARLARVLGIAVADEAVERILRALGMRVTASADGWSVLPPTRRFDIAIEEDLIEEIARIHGYAAIPVTLPAGAFALVAPAETRVADAVLRRQLASADYVEAIDYAFLDAGTLQAWNLDGDAVALANPLTAELGVMRTALLPGLVDSLRRNVVRQQARVRLFELGRVFQAQPAGAAPREIRRIAAVACGAAHGESWDAARREVDFHDVKGDLERLLALAGLVAQFRPADAPHGHPGRSAEVWLGEARIGWIGHLHPRLLKALDLDHEVVAFELDLDAAATRAVPRAGELSRFPSVRRDIALVVPDSVAWGTVEAGLRDALGARLRELVLFDRYVGPGLDAGSRSLAIGLILQDVSRTLTDLDADQAVGDAVAALARDHGARLRG
jgi:phenylalanyl-tRNA synthetase beta chain